MKWLTFFRSFIRNATTNKKKTSIPFKKERKGEPREKPSIMACTANGAQVNIKNRAVPHKGVKKKKKARPL